MKQKDSISPLIIGVGCIVVIAIVGLQIVSKKQTKGLSKTIQTAYIDQNNGHDTKKVDATFIRNMVESSSLISNQNREPETHESQTELMSSEKPLQRDYETAPVVLGELIEHHVVIPIGTQLSAHLLEDLSNQNYSQPVHAMIKEDITVNDYVIKTKGARLVGRFYALKENNRLFVRFTKLIMNNKHYKIDACAMDLTDQKRGLIANVDAKVGQRVLSGIVQTASTLIRAIANTTDSTGLVSKGTQSVEGLTLEKLETQRLLSVTSQPFDVLFDDVITLKLQGGRS